MSPIPASSGKTNRHRLNRGGDRQANASLHRIVVVRLRYQRLIADRKTLKTYYTTPAATTLLTHLAIPDDLDWADPETLRSVPRIADRPEAFCGIMLDAYSEGQGPPPSPRWNDPLNMRTTSYLEGAQHWCTWLCSPKSLDAGGCRLVSDCSSDCVVRRGRHGGKPRRAVKWEEWHGGPTGHGEGPQAHCLNLDVGSTRWHCPAYADENGTCRPTRLLRWALWLCRNKSVVSHSEVSAISDSWPRTEERTIVAPSSTCLPTLLETPPVQQQFLPQVTDHRKWLRLGVGPAGDQEVVPWLNGPAQSWGTRLTAFPCCWKYRQCFPGDDVLR